MSSVQHAVLVGSLLGDGTLRLQQGKLNALFEVNHSFDSKEYVDWKYQVFKNLVLTPPKARRGNGERVAYRFTTRSLNVFTEYYRWFYPDRRKIIPEDLKLEPLSLAVWYMDDGTRSRSACYLNTQQFTVDEQEFLKCILFRDYKIKSELNRDRQYLRLRVTTESTKVLRTVILPHILPCFRYKLDDNPVTTDSKEEASTNRRGNTPTLVIS